MTKATITNAPIQNHEREIFMDALRGFAILGIFIANLNFLSHYRGSDGAIGPWLLKGSDDVMSFLHHMFIEGKFYSIFSLLILIGIISFYFLLKNLRNQRKINSQKDIIHNQNVTALKKQKEIEVIQAMIEGEEAERKRIAGFALD